MSPPRSRWAVPGLVVAVLLGSLAEQAAAQPAAQSDHTEGLSLLGPGDRGLRGDLAWLVDRGVLDLPLGTWPLPSSQLRSALARVQPERLGAADADALARVQRALARSGPGAELTVRMNTARHPALDGDDVAKGLAQSVVSLRGGGAAWGGQLSVAATADPLWTGDDGLLNLDGSYLAGQLAGVVVWAGVTDRWWGPGQFTSPILSNAARPIASVIVRRAEDVASRAWLLRWLGPWGYELSAGRLSGYTPTGTRTLGFRLHVRPSPRVELGMSRSILWAGHGRPGGARALWRALRGDSNIDDPTIQGQDPSNEVAGFDLRVSGRWPDDSSWAAYAHIVGEDEAGGLPAKRFGTLGFQARTVAGSNRVEATVEATDTVTSRLFGLSSGRSTGPAAVHGTYVDGYYQGGLPIGAAIGGGGDLLSFGVAWTPIDHPARLRVQATLFHGDVGGGGTRAINAAYPNDGTLSGFTVGVEGEAAGPAATWQLGLSAQRHPAAARRTIGLTAGLTVPLRAGR